MEPMGTQTIKCRSSEHVDFLSWLKKTEGSSARANVYAQIL